MYVCTLILGQPWTKKRGLQIDKSDTFSWRKFKFVCQGQWAYFKAYSSEQYLEDRKRRDRAHAAIDAKKQQEKMVLLENTKAEGGAVVTENMPAHEEKKESVVVPTSGLYVQLKRVDGGDSMTVCGGQRTSLFQTQCDIKGASCKLIIDGGSCTKRG